MAQTRINDPYGSRPAPEPEASDCSLSSSPQSDEESTRTRLNHPRNIKLFFWTLGLLLAFLQAVANRNSPSTLDIIAYLDVADAYLRGDWGQAINGNWSPLYSWLLALALGILKPSPFWEFPMVKLVNFLVFVFSFASLPVSLKVRCPNFVDRAEI